MAKVVFSIIVLNGEPFLESCIESLLPFGRVIAVEGPVTYWQKRGYTTSTDNTNTVLNRLLGADNVIHGIWNEKNDMLRAAERMIPDDASHIFCVDSDEIWKAEDLVKIFEILDGWDSVAFKPYSFYGGFERYMTGYEEECPPWGWQRIQRWFPGAVWKTHRPPTILSPDGDAWRDHQHLSANNTAAMSVHFFHYSYCLPNQMKDKADYYAYRNPNGTIPNYFEQVYLPWVRGDDRAKKQIEHKWRGVHNELPSKRGDCFTREFKGEHPPAIAKRLPELRERFARELEQFK